MRLVGIVGVATWLGTSLLLSTQRWFARRPLVERLRPYVPGGAVAQGDPASPVASARDLLVPLASGAGERLGRLFGVSESPARRLQRIHDPTDPAAFRLRQLGWSVGAFFAAGMVTTASGVGPIGTLAVLVGAPLLAALVIEQQLSSASARWRQRLRLELPVVAEQIGMLLAAGYSLSGALNRVATRSTGACGQDLARVCGRIRQGLAEAAALDEWADLASVDAVTRLVRILGLNRETADLGRLIAEEARAMRRDVQRELLERIERREQQVWVPVTVATLVPGVIFLAVPFLEAMRLFAS